MKPREAHKKGGKLLDAEGLAELLGISRAQVYRLSRNQSIPHYRLGRYLKFDPKEVLESTRHERLLGGEREIS